MGKQAMPPQMFGQPMGPYQKPGWPMAPQFMKGPAVPPPELVYGGQVTQAGLPEEQSYLENILRMNRGKTATVYTTNENNPEWAAKVFKGRVENAARDHIVLSDPATGTRYVVLMVNVDYLTFDEPLRFQPGIYQR